jgi:F-type H+-transporting ATPase subunit b
MLRAWQAVALATLALALLPATALAADDILAPRFDLGIWTLVIFVLLLLLLRKMAWGPMLEGLQKREQSIRSSVEEAKKTREEMEHLRAQFKAELETAHAQIPKLMDEARANAQRMADEMRAKANDEIEADKKRLRRELEIARDQALQELSTHAAQLATLISAKAIGRSLSEQDHRRLVDEALREVVSTDGSRS